MKMDIVAGSQNDEFYTPRYAILPLIKYLKPQSTIWCPFDTKESNFVKMFESQGFKVIATHLESGLDHKTALNKMSNLNKANLNKKIRYSVRPIQQNI